MAAMTILTLLERCNTFLNDKNWFRWTKQELLNHYNDAVLAIILKRPDANAITETVSCVAGTRQVLPDDALRLIDIICNTGGKVIRPIPRRALDDAYPDWHTGNTATSADAFVYDDRDPKTFYLYPGVESGVQVDMVYSKAPETKTIEDIDNGELVELDDVYINPIIEFILYRAYSKDAEYVANANLAQAHYQAFIEQMGEKQQVDAALAQSR